MKDNKVYFNHILDCVEHILSYTEGMDEESFYKNFMVQDAVLRNYEIIGEAAKNIDDDLRNLYPEIPWKKMSGMRDKLIHSYFHVDLQIIWETTTEILPSLLIDLKKIQPKI